MEKVFDIKFLRNFIIKKKFEIDGKVCHRIAKEYGIEFNVELGVEGEEIFSFSKLPDSPGRINMSFNREFISSYDAATLFSHELAHGIQWSHLQKFDKDSVNAFFTTSFERCLMYERTAERLAYFISKEYFSDIMDELNMSHRSFNAYKRQSDKDFLFKYFDFDKCQEERCWL